MMLKGLVEKYGKEKVNILTKYPSILTLHKFGDRGRFTDEITTNVDGETLYASEKIDGTNVVKHPQIRRIIEKMLTDFGYLIWLLLKT